MSFVTQALGSLIGDVTGTTQQANAATTAANTQANAANYAADLQNKAFQQTQANLSPYMSIGTSVLPQLLKSLGYSGSYGGNGQLTGISGQGFQFNPSDLTQTPGYQFSLQQGLKAAANSASGGGLNMSGAQQKGLADYATGLASNTFNQQYNNALSTYNANAGQLSNLLNLGQNAAAGLGQAGMANASAIGNNLTAGANATAAGQIASGNAQSNALSSAMGLGQGAAGIYALGNYAPAGGSSLWASLGKLF
jgi:hypothetical protein